MGESDFTNDTNKKEKKSPKVIGRPNEPYISDEKKEYVSDEKKVIGRPNKPHTDDKEKLIKIDVEKEKPPPPPKPKPKPSPPPPKITEKEERLKIVDYDYLDDFKDELRMLVPCYGVAILCITIMFIAVFVGLARGSAFWGKNVLKPAIAFEVFF